MKPFSQAMPRHYYMFSHSLHIPKCYQEPFFEQKLFLTKEQWIYRRIIISTMDREHVELPFLPTLLILKQVHCLFCLCSSLKTRGNICQIKLITTKSWTSQMNLRTKCFFQQLYSIPHYMLKLLNGNKFKKLELSCS